MIDFPRLSSRHDKKSLYSTSSDDTSCYSALAIILPIRIHSKREDSDNQVYRGISGKEWRDVERSISETFCHEVTLDVLPQFLIAAVIYAFD